MTLEQFESSRKVLIAVYITDLILLAINILLITLSP